MTTQTTFSGVVPRVDLLDITRPDTELAALMNAAGNAARAVSADNKVRVAQRLAQAIIELEQQLKTNR
jgi:transcriptional regulator of aromatic amino acid metabolism